MAKSITPKNLPNVFSTALRVLKSGNRIGIFQLFLYGLSLVFIPVNLVLSVVQNSIMVRPYPMRQPVIFISGYSRSGTTLLYQVLARVWDVEYFNNMLVLFPRSYILVNYLFRKLSRARTREFKNFYGLSWGLTGTNDGAQIFYKWANEDDFVLSRPLSSSSVNDIRVFFGTHEHYLKKPLLMKNCNMYQMFDQYAEILPNAYFIFVKRDPLEIVQSTLKAREFVQGDRSMRWEFSFKNVRGKGDEDPIEEICLNVKYCFDRMEIFSKKVSPDRLQVIEYEEFCNDPVECIDKLSRKIFHRPADRDELMKIIKPFRKSAGPSVSDIDRSKIKDVIERSFPFSRNL